MVNRATRLRWRRLLRRRKRKVEDIGLSADEGLERHFLKRFGRVMAVRRFVLSWLGLLLLICGILISQIRSLPSLYAVPTPVPGGIYTEGIIGSFTNANPVFATGSVDRTVAGLVFSGLFKNDGEGRLVGDLASGWKVNNSGRIYTVTLKDNVFWHDGQPVTADDVAFTYRVIQNQDAKSPLEASWRGIKVMAKDNRTITFELPNILSSFPYSMVNGIVPKHVLDGVPMVQMRSVSFNTNNPIGSGPFKWRSIEVVGNSAETREEHIGLEAYDNYHEGRPKLNQYIVYAFRDQNRMVDSFKDHEISAMAGLDKTPDKLASLTTREHNIPLESQVGIFFRNSHKILSRAPVRRALTMATDNNAIIGQFGYPVVKSDSPVLSSHFAYKKNLSQMKYNPENAAKTLETDGWKLNGEGLRQKGNQVLRINLVSQDNSTYSFIAHEIEKQWRALGVEVNLLIRPENELQSSLAEHNYDTLLYGIGIGPDPDVFPYWHSSQAEVRARNRLNFSEYRSDAADEALEAGRTRQDRSVRSIKYVDFLKVWRDDAPAVMLYQPRFLYITRGELFNLDLVRLNTGQDRLHNVHNWMIRLEDRPAEDQS